jgi:CheY-like chemotaxis protein
VYRVKDGDELLDFLLRRGAYTEPQPPRPTLILLDLNMPRKDGREALAEIKQNPALCNIPVIVMTTSRVEEDILKAYELGVSSFIRKPVTFEQLCHVLRIFDQYWLQIVELPPNPMGDDE